MSFKKKITLVKMTPTKKHKKQEKQQEKKHPQHSQKRQLWQRRRDPARRRRDVLGRVLTGAALQQLREPRAEAGREAPVGLGRREQRRGGRGRGSGPDGVSGSRRRGRRLRGRG